MSIRQEQGRESYSVTVPKPAPAPELRLRSGYEEADCIRKIGTDGIIYRVAGTGANGDGGDGGPAILAQLEYPLYYVGATLPLPSVSG